MLSLLRPASVLLGLLTALAGVAYPLAVTGATQAVFPNQARGSLVRMHGRTVGSSLVGQPFDDPRYFWGRPSATTPVPYNAGASAGSNLGPSNPALETAVRERVAALRSAHPERASAPVPVDLATTSASGLDPDISPAAALYQAERVARIRGLPAQRVRNLIEANIQGRTLGVLGEPRVNVLQLNLALDGVTRTGPQQPN
ncbi:MAG TPA: potassium-transporting ATPase subunit KdpC [Polyangiaceae bacterium]